MKPSIATVMALTTLAICAPVMVPQTPAVAESASAPKRTDRQKEKARKRRSKKRSKRRGRS